jgi:hypothetical protein
MRRSEEEPEARSKAHIIRGVCQALARDDRDRASVLAREYPFEPTTNGGRRYSELEMTRIFFRDGFIDRYSGERLVFPGTLRLLSTLMPAEFPSHANWKMSDSHIVYWELFPTIDHVKPVARGGPDDDSNWVTTSMLRNSAKSSWTLEELGWTMHPPGSIEEWDGLTSWFVEYTAKNPGVVSTAYLRLWRAAAVKMRG